LFGVVCMVKFYCLSDDPVAMVIGVIGPIIIVHPVCFFVQDSRD